MKRNYVELKRKVKIGRLQVCHDLVVRRKEGAREMSILCMQKIENRFLDVLVWFSVNSGGGSMWA